MIRKDYDLYLHQDIKRKQVSTWNILWLTVSVVLLVTELSFLNIWKFPIMVLLFILFLLTCKQL